jgi:hypothetical protein
MAAAGARVHRSGTPPSGSGGRPWPGVMGGGFLHSSFVGSSRLAPTRGRPGGPVCAGGTEVVLRVVLGLFRWRCCGGDCDNPPRKIRTIAYTNPLWSLSNNKVSSCC